MSNSDSGFDREVDEYINAFESAWQAGIADSLEAFLPPDDHPAHGEIVVELTRIDLERRWKTPDKKVIDTYFAEFPRVFEKPHYRQALAFEEFRLRRLAGEEVSAADYARTYGISTDSWPALPVGSAGEAASSATGSWVDEVSQWEFASKQRLAAARKRLPKVGAEFLGFELVGILGEGALGRVYLARQGDLSRRFVALKVAVHPSDEPQRLAQLQHTNIVPIYSCHQTGPLQATCMPFLGANTLADVLGSVQVDAHLPRTGQAFVSTLVARNSETVIREATREAGDSVDLAVKSRRGALQALESMSYLQTVVWMAERITHALAHAHEHGVVHCDLKPANIVLTDEGEPLLVDFHLAAEYADGAATSYVVGGTLPYMAPEHLQAIRHGGRVAPSCDVYSTGVLIYEMLTGELPFPRRAGPFDDIVDELIADRRRLEPLRKRLAQAATPALAAIVLKCLQPEPAERYPTAIELHDDLQRQLEHKPLKHVREPSMRERIVKWSRRHPRLSSATSLTTIALVLLLVLATGWRSTRLELAKRNAQLAHERLVEAVTRSEAILTAPEATIDQWREVDRDLRQRLAPYGVLENRSSWRHSPLLSALSKNRRQEIAHTVGRAAALLAISETRQGLRDTEAKRREHWKHAKSLTKLANQLLGKAPNIGAQAERVRGESMSRPPHDSYLEALARFQKGDLAAASSILEQLSETTPRRWSVWFGLGSCYYAMGRFRDAEAAYTTAIALFPDSTHAYAYRGLARLKQQHHREAIRDLETAVRKAPRRHDLWINLALAQLADQQLAAAIQSLDQALKLDRSSVRAYLIRARAKERAGDAAGASEDRAAALKLTPRDPLGWVARGMAALRSDPTAALRDFKAALELDPHSPEALQNTATILADYLQQTSEAIPYVSRLIKIQPKQPEHVAWRGVLLARLGRRAPAHSDAQQALKQSPTAVTTLQIACIYALTSKQHTADRETAVQLVRRALAQRPLLAELAATDTDLAPLRADPEFQRLVQAASTLSRR